MRTSSNSRGFSGCTPPASKLDWETDACCFSPRGILCCLFARVENGVTKFSPTPPRHFGPILFQNFDQKPSSFQWGIIFIFILFLAAEEPTSLGGGGGLKLQNWLASVHPGTYASMPHPRFGVKDVCYTDKKDGTKKAFFEQAASLYHMSRKHVHK